jgi:hypothetical protein
LQLVLELASSHLKTRVSAFTAALSIKIKQQKQTRNDPSTAQLKRPLFPLIFSPYGLAACCVRAWNVFDSEACLW